MITIFLPLLTTDFARSRGISVWPHQNSDQMSAVLRLEEEDVERRGTITAVLVPFFQTAPSASLLPCPAPSDTQTQRRVTTSTPALGLESGMASPEHSVAEKTL